MPWPNITFFLFLRYSRLLFLPDNVGYGGVVRGKSLIHDGTFTGLVSLVTLLGAAPIAEVSSFFLTFFERGHQRHHVLSVLVHILNILA